MKPPTQPKLCHSLGLQNGAEDQTKNQNQMKGKQNGQVTYSHSSELIQFQEIFLRELIGVLRKPNLLQPSRYFTWTLVLVGLSRLTTATTSLWLVALPNLQSHEAFRKASFWACRHYAIPYRHRRTYCRWSRALVAFAGVVGLSARQVRRCGLQATQLTRNGTAGNHSVNLITDHRRSPFRAFAALAECVRISLPYDAAGYGQKR